MRAKEEKRLIAAGRHLNFVQRDGWEYVERVEASGAVVIVPVTDSQTLILTDQYRPALAAYVVDLPAGLVGDGAGGKHEDATAAGQRELEEETGYHAGELKFLAEGPSAAGVCSERVIFLLATGLTRVGEGGGEGSEEITVLEAPLEPRELEAWLAERRAAGRLIDLKIYTALYLMNHSAAEPLASKPPSTG